MKALSAYSVKPLFRRVGIAALGALALAGVQTTVFTPAASACETYVSGYYRSDGRYVSGHYRTCANSTRWDNWSTRGNYNPYTGERGYHSPYYYPSYTPSYSRPSYGCRSYYYGC